MEAVVKLLVKKNQTEYQATEVIAKKKPVGRDEFNAAGQRGLHPSFMVEVWDFEYTGQTQIEVDGNIYTIYRTYGPKANGKMELYAAERTGKG